MSCIMYGVRYVRYWYAAVTVPHPENCTFVEIAIVLFGLFVIWRRYHICLIRFRTVFRFLIIRSVIIRSKFLNKSLYGTFKNVLMHYKIPQSSLMSFCTGSGKTIMWKMLRSHFLIKTRILEEIMRSKIVLVLGANCFYFHRMVS